MGQKDKDNTAPDMSDVENGPLTQANRECRDIFCCLLFLAAIGGMGYLTYAAYYNHDPSVLFRGVNSAGLICGDKNDAATKDLPYLYFTNPFTGTLQGTKTCVSACPVWTGAANTLPTGNPTIASWAKQFNADGELVGGGTTTSGQLVGYPTTLLLSRVCIPNSNLFGAAKISQSVFSSAMSQGQVASLISDVMNNWMYLLAALGFAIVVSFIFMFLLRCIAGCVVWCSLFGIILFFIGIGLLFLYSAGVIGGSSANTVVTTLGVPSVSQSDNNKVYGWISIGIGCFFLLLVLCCCSRLRLAVAVCKSAGQFVSSVCSAVLVPIIQTIFQAGLWGACLVAMVYLVSGTQMTAKTDDYFTSIKSYDDQYMIRFYAFVFGTLWCSAFIGAMTIFIIASAACMWYYSHGPGQELNSPISRSYKMVFRYHFGSLAFGALLLAIVQFLQFIVEIFKKQAQASGGNNKCIEYVTKCITCCLACVQCIVKFINTQAYIQIALRGKNFCYAAKDGFQLAWSNAMRFAIVSGVGTVLMFLGKIFIAAATAGAFYALITFVPSIQKNYTKPFYQIIIAGIIGYVIAILFMAVYAVAMDTLLQCFIVDQANQKGKGKKAAVYAPADLAALMETD